MMKVLVLHGCCQTGQAIAGYMRSGIRKFGEKAGIEYVFIDAPYPHQDGGLTWTDPPLDVSSIWSGETALEATPGILPNYDILDATFDLIRRKIDENKIEAILGFSQGSFVAYEFMRYCPHPNIKRIVAIAGYPFLTDTYETLPVDLLNVVHPFDSVVPATLAYPNANKVYRLEHNNKSLTEPDRQGHVMPTRASHCRSIVNFLLSGEYP